MAPVKRILLVILALLVAGAGIYGYTAARRERTFRQLIARGEAALARDDTFAAIENFSGTAAARGSDPQRPPDG